MIHPCVPQHGDLSHFTLLNTWHIFHISYLRHGFQTLETKTWTLDSLPGKRFMLIFMARPPQPPAAIN